MKRFLLGTLVVVALFGVSIMIFQSRVLQEDRVVSSANGTDPIDVGFEAKSLLDAGRDDAAASGIPLNQAALEAIVLERDFRNAAHTLASQADSVVDVFGALDSARMQGFERVADELQSTAHHMCDAISNDDLSGHIGRSSVGYLRLHKYCDGYLSKVNEFNGMVDNSELYLNVIKLHAEDFIKFMGSIDSGSESDSLLRYIANAPSPVFLHGAKIGIRKWLAQSGKTLDILEEIKLGPSTDKFRLLNTAVDFYGCRKFRNCGPRSFKSIEACLMAGSQCGPGQGYMEIMYRHLSPYEVEIIHEIMSRIFAHRAEIH